LRHFEITGEIGSGGFGIVYYARDHRLERTVAIKEFMPSAIALRRGPTEIAPVSEARRATFEAGLRSFVNEARVLAGFEHPNLIQVFDFWHENGTAYMVMPLCRGVSLRQVLKDLGTPPSEAWLRDLLRPLLDALSLIHRRNFVHRDISPDNIQVLPSGAPLLLDFGAAREVLTDVSQSLTVILRPGFTPIEQYAEGAPSKQGPWTDLYALAAVVYFAITGAPPRTSVARLIGNDVQPFSTTAGGRYSPAFLAGLDQALAVRPEDRPQSVAAFAAAIKLDLATADAADEQPAPPVPQEAPRTPPIPARVEQREPSPRKEAPDPSPAAFAAWRAVVGGVIGIVALCVALALGLRFWLAPRAQPQPASPPPIAAPATTESVPPLPATVEPAAITPATSAPAAPVPATIEPSPLPPATIEPSPLPPATSAPAQPTPATPEPARPALVTVEPAQPAPATNPPATAAAQAKAPPAATPNPPKPSGPSPDRQARPTRPAPPVSPDSPDAGSPASPASAPAKADALPARPAHRESQAGGRVPRATEPDAAHGTAPGNRTPPRTEKTDGTAARMRCSDVLMRLQMGEVLSEPENATFQKECKR
jgi:serine/threonine protein kinase